MKHLALLSAALVAALPAVAAAQEGGNKMSLSIQGAVGVGELVRGLDSDPDVTYGAIVGLHMGGPLSLEFEYQRAENDVNGLVGSPTLEQNGILGHVRFDLSPGPLGLFLYGGAGWVRYRADTSVLDVEEDRVVIPAGAGLELLFKPLVVGIRGEYQWIPNDVAGEDADFWKVVGTAGFRL